MMVLEVRQLSFSYGSAAVLQNIGFSAGSGEMIALLGPNGVGKTTLFRCLLGFLMPSDGQILLDGKPIGSFSGSELARAVAYIPQSYFPTFNYTVQESVLMGVTGRLGLFDIPTAEQKKLVMDTLASLGIDHLAERGSRKISGGERQLMLLARALVQNAHVLIMDEPTANLDYGNSVRVMERVQALAASGYTVIFSTHDPNQAFRYATRVLALCGGTILSDGAPREVLREDTLSTLYGIRVAVRDVFLGEKEQTVSIPI